MPAPFASKPELEPVAAAALEFVALFRFNPDAFIVTTVTDRTFLAVNPGFIHLTGYSQDEVMGKTMSELGLWVDSMAHAHCIRDLNLGQPKCHQLDYLTANRVRQMGLVSVEIITVADYPVLLTIVRDVNQYQQELSDLRTRSQQLQAFTEIATIALQASSLPIALRAMLKQVRKVTGFNFLVMESYDAEQRMVRFLAAEGLVFSDDSVVEFPEESTLSGEVARTRQPIIRQGEQATSAGEIPLLANLPSPKSVTCLPLVGRRGLYGTLTLAHPRVISIKPGMLEWLQELCNYMATFAQRSQQEEQLRYTAFHDPLTGLPNRTLFEDRVGRAFARGRRDPSSTFAVLFLDLDDFKRVNDELGHNSGDRLLAELAQRFEMGLRPGDTVSRMGGDEFTFLLDGIQQVTDVSRITERILSQIAQPFVVHGHEVAIGASIGIAIASDSYETVQELIRDADAAMYRAKASGKNCYAVFDASMHQSAQAQLQLEAELRQAIANHQLRVLYQPIVSLKSGRIEGLEALVRWQHPQRGLLTPSDFLQVAEDTELVEEIDRWMLDEVCLQMQDWQQLSEDLVPPTAINFSARKLQNPRLATHIGRILSDLALGPEHLQLEFAESALSQLSEATTATLQRLQQIGIKAAIDDFGTGFLPISKLYGFPVDRIKIDGSFVKEIEQGGQNLSIVRTLATLARQLGLSVTAEGVETAGQLSLLRAVGCESGQGFFFSEPLEGETVWGLITSHPRW
ncbi:MAG: EAL domain-containing protein [Synechococcus sp.]